LFVCGFITISYGNEAYFKDFITWFSIASITVIVFEFKFATYIQLVAKLIPIPKGESPTRMSVSSLLVKPSITEIVLESRFDAYILLENGFTSTSYGDLPTSMFFSTIDFSISITDIVLEN